VPVLSSSVSIACQPFYGLVSAAASSDYLSHTFRRFSFLLRHVRFIAGNLFQNCLIAIPETG